MDSLDDPPPLPDKAKVGDEVRRSLSSKIWFKEKLKYFESFSNVEHLRFATLSWYNDKTNNRAMLLVQF